jgi:hypothetical protein
MRLEGEVLNYEQTSLTISILGYPCPRLFKHRRRKISQSRRIPGGGSRPLSHFLPATYGLPETAAGYAILAVQTFENTDCASSDRNQFILQPFQAAENMDDFIQSLQPNAVIQALTDLGLGGSERWGFNSLDSV